MKERTTLFMFVIVIFIFFSTQVFARGPHGKERPMGKFHGHAKEVMEALQLTDDQKNDLHKLCKVSGEKIADNWKKIEELQASLSEKVLLTTGTSKSGHDKIINQIADLRSQMIKNRLKHWIKFVEILDSDQKKILAGRLKELKKKRPQQRKHMNKYFPFP